MSVADVTARIQQLQAQFAQLGAPTVTPMAASPGAADFSAALAAAGVGTTSSTGSAGSTGAVANRDGGAGGGVTGDEVVAEARKYLGIPYQWGGTDPKKGLDCSGLVQLVYKNLGIDLPRVSYQQATAGRPVANLKEARPGDILAFDRPVDHVGIYIGNGKMIEAPRTGLDVRVIDVYETPTAIRRVLPDQPVGPVGGAGGGSSVAASVPYAGLFNNAGRRYGVEPTLLAAVAKQESGYNPSAVSSAGARGLMQLMPATARGLGVDNPMNPTQAVDGAARLLRDLIREFDRVDLALAAYNAGPGAVHRYDGIPPYAETRAYVPAVLSHKQKLERA